MSSQQGSDSVPRPLPERKSSSIGFASPCLSEPAPPGSRGSAAQMGRVLCNGIAGGLGAALTACGRAYFTLISVTTA